MNNRTRANGDNTGAHALNGGTSASGNDTLAGGQAGTVVKSEPSTAAQAEAKPAPRKAPLPVDEHHGKGGEYHLVDGKRVRVEPKKS
ncbi:MAG TPA: hypothetical protein VLK85_06820 [Ramlibacter sp.]|nr:hypothetical protein [Ramlibacter sp.]